MTQRPALGAALMHPVPLAALALLVVNDHLLKARHPGLVTGKLSDIAGMVLAPLVLAAIADATLPLRWVRRRDYPVRSAWVCAAAVAVVFAATKTWSPATHAYEAVFAALWAKIRWIMAQALGQQIWSDRIVLVRDPTDLVAIPMGAVAALVRITLSRPPSASPA
jgi:hypothetical protein